jgi:hypothetical protein
MNGMLDKGMEDEAGGKVGDNMMQLILRDSRSRVDAEPWKVQAPWQLPHLSCAGSHKRRFHCAWEMGLDCFSQL